MAVVSMGVVVVGAAVASVCVAVLDHEARRLEAATRRLAAVTAGSPPVGATR